MTKINKEKFPKEVYIALEEGYLIAYDSLEQASKECNNKTLIGLYKLEKLGQLKFDAKFI